MSVCVCLYCCLSYPAYNAHAPYCHVWHEVRDSFMGRKIFVLILVANLSERFLILRRTVLYINITYISHHVKYPLLLSDRNKTCIFSADF